MTLLGGFTLSYDNEIVEVSRTLQRLLAFLGVRREAARAQIAGALWPEHRGDNAFGCLRTTLWRLRQSGLPIVRTNGEMLMLDDQVRVDLVELTEERLLRGRVDLLPGWYEDWVLVERERLRQSYLSTVEKVARRRLRQDRYGEALDAALAALRAEPLREGLHRLLIEIHLAEDNYGEALLSYHGYRDLLRRELGVDPSEGIQRLLM